MPSDVDHDLYTPLDVAKEEIKARWRNADLRNKVETFVGTLPDPFQQEPRSCLWRHIASLNMESSRFLELSTQSGLSPLFVELLDDKFVSLNVEKRSLVKLPVLQGKNKNGQLMIRYRAIVAAEHYDGLPFNVIKTLWGERLVDFHHRIFIQHHAQLPVFDLSAWSQTHGGCAKDWYKAALALSICHGVLFENYITTNGEEQRFCREVVFPAFESVVRVFGIKPLIVPTLPHAEASDRYWNCYAADIDPIIDDGLNRCANTLVSACPSAPVSVPRTG